MKNMNLLIATLTLSALALEAQVPPPPGTVLSAAREPAGPHRQRNLQWTN